MQAHVVKSGLLLSVNSHMVTLIPNNFIFGSRSLERMTHLLLYFSPELVETPLINQPHEPCFLSICPQTVIAINQENCFAQSHYIARVYPNIHGNGGFATLGREE